METNKNGVCFDYIQLQGQYWTRLPGKYIVCEYVRACVHVLCVRACVCACECVHVNVCVCIRVYVFMCMFGGYMYKCVHVYVCVHICTSTVVDLKSFSL